MLTRRAFTTSLAAAAVVAATPSAASAGTQNTGNKHFPDVIALPNAFQPEGIAIGRQPYAYLGSLANGDIYRISLASGRGKVISAGPGTPSVGMKIDHRGRLFVSGGAAGDGRVVDTGTGRVLASYQFAAAPTFINDVTLSRHGAFFTDSQQPFLYRVPLDLRGEAVPLPLTGDIVYQAGFNVNGISGTPDGRALLVVQSNTATIFRVDPTTAVAVFRLDARGTSGRLVTRLTSPNFDVPTTIAAFGNRLYLPNARFGVTVTPETTYSAVAIRAA